MFIQPELGLRMAHAKLDEARAESQRAAALHAVTASPRIGTRAGVRQRAKGTAVPVARRRRWTGLGPKAPRTTNGTSV